MFNFLKRNKWYIEIISNDKYIKETNNLKDILTKYRGNWALEVIRKDNNHTIKGETNYLKLSCNSRIRFAWRVISTDYNPNIIDNRTWRIAI